MTEGDIALAPMPQLDGQVKPRPVVLLRQLPPFGDWLICGISTQMRQRALGFDDIIEPRDADFAASGLRDRSLIRLGFLVAVPAVQILGVIGSVSRGRHAELLKRLADHLQSPSP